MRKGTLLLCLHFLLPVVMSKCPSQCSCIDTVVDCSGRQLKPETLPKMFPSSTREIRLNNNQLTNIPKGLFDKTPMLREVMLNGNPWNCDCDILYLRSWLQKQQDRTLFRDVICTFPQDMKGRLVMYLTEDELLSSCQYGYCNLAFFTQIGLLVFVIVHAILLVFLIAFFKRFAKFSKEASRVRKEGYQTTDHAGGEHDQLLYNHNMA